MLLTAVLVSCNPRKGSVDAGDVNVGVTSTNADQPKMQPVYNASEKRINDLLHTRLEVSFDWPNRQLNGEAMLKLTPYARPIDSLILDAKAMDIHDVKIVSADGAMTPLVYTYNGWALRIGLDRQYKRGEEYQVFIKYTANPEEVEQQGSAAISEAKGLYFINHDGSNPKKHMEIWTQGETESSSTWFPTIDSPNEKTTQEIYMTVQDKYTTLSNGLMEGSTVPKDGYRTDHWVMSQPHAPYLFMMAVGEFKVVKDEWTRKDGSKMEVNYYVEEKYEPYAKDIFGKTPKMLSYFSDLLGVEYPWAKYSQIVVRDYVSGAMENTTATIHGDFLYMTKRELIDDNNESIIAHELFHHWFGDLVTCESWANLPLNESFANYSQYLWDEYEHGRMEADMNAYDEMDGYFLSAQQGGHVDMIRYDYENKEQMFDGHSYNKGGRILNMLRTYLGDEVFFMALNNYLTENAYTATEIHELRMQFEKASGEDLNWFFNQWFLASGHPVVTINQSYDVASKELTVSIDQKQKLEEWPLYQLPIDIDIYINGKMRRERVWVMNEKNEFKFMVDQAPDLVNVDATKTTLWKKTDNKDLSQWVYQLNNAKLWLDKKEAFDKLEKSGNGDAMDAIMKALNHEFYDVRLMAIGALDATLKNRPEEVKKALVSMLKKEEHPAVRAKIIDFLGKNYSDLSMLNPIFEKGLEDESLKVVAASLKGYAKHNGEKGLAKAKTYESQESAKVQLAVADIYANYGTPAEKEFFTKNFTEMSGFNKFTFLSHYFKYLTNQNEELAAEGIPVFVEVIESDGLWYERLAGYQLLNGLQAHFDKRANQIDNQMASMEKEGGLSTDQEMELEKVKQFCLSKKSQIAAKLAELKEKETDANILQYMPK
jgi:aminopeptidase N